MAKLEYVVALALALAARGFVAPVPQRLRPLRAEDADATPVEAPTADALLEDFRGRREAEPLEARARDFAASVRENVAAGDSGPGLVFVGAQVVLLVLLAVGDVPGVGAAAQAVAGPGCLAGGLALIAAGVLELGPGNLTPFATPTPANQLKTGGVFGVTRHPIYAGVVLAAGGLAVATASFQRALVAVALYALLSAKADLEERLLAAKHPGYRAYARVTPKLLPSPFDALG